VSVRTGFSSFSEKATSLLDEEKQARLPNTPRTAIIALARTPPCLRHRFFPIDANLQRRFPRRWTSPVLHPDFFLPSCSAPLFSPGDRALLPLSPAQTNHFFPDRIIAESSKPSPSRQHMPLDPTISLRLYLDSPFFFPPNERASARYTTQDALSFSFGTQDSSRWTPPPPPPIPSDSCTSVPHPRRELSYTSDVDHCANRKVLSPPPPPPSQSGHHSPPPHQHGCKLFFFSVSDADSARVSLPAQLLPARRQSRCDHLEP